MAHSQSSEMAVPAVLLHLEDRVDPEALVGREALVVLEVLMVRDHLSDQVRLARKPRDPEQ